MGPFKVVSILLSVLSIVTAQSDGEGLGEAAAVPKSGKKISKEGLTNLQSAMHKWADGKSTNIVSLMSQNGEVLHWDAYSKGSQKVAKDSIYNIMSMTKPISGVCMMTFYEEGKFKLDDPVAKHIPSFADLTVKGTPQKHPMTMAELMSHSAGFPANMVATGATLKAGVEALAKSNLAFQPGEGWAYGPGVEIQGYLMEKWAGKDFADIMSERILKPLNMTDTNFWVPSEKRNRVMASAMAPPSSKPKRLIPSYGLHATAEDYWKFGQMVVNGGEFRGKRVLKPETVDLMRTNVLHMDKGVYVNFMGGGKGIGFGLDFAVVVDPKPTSNSMPKGCFFWVRLVHNLCITFLKLTSSKGGAFGTIFWLDITNNIVFVGMVTQLGSLSGDGNLRQAAAKAIYEGLH
jgi:CubicO group peptidase (beta-lactamase class C family)